MKDAESSCSLTCELFEVWSDGEDWRGRVASPDRQRRGEEVWGGRVASPTREVTFFLKRGCLFS